MGESPVHENLNQPVDFQVAQPSPSPTLSCKVQTSSFFSETWLIRSPGRLELGFFPPVSLIRAQLRQLSGGIGAAQGTPHSPSRKHWGAVRGTDCTTPPPTRTHYNCFPASAGSYHSPSILPADLNKSWPSFQAPALSPLNLCLATSGLNCGLANQAANASPATDTGKHTEGRGRFGSHLDYYQMLLCHFLSVWL